MGNDSATAMGKCTLPRSASCFLTRFLMIFSKRYELGQRLDEWCEEHNVCKEGMGYISALHSLGYTIGKQAPSGTTAASAETGRLLTGTNRNTP